MDSDNLYEIMRASVTQLQKDNDDLKLLDEAINRSATIADYGFDIVSFGEFTRDLEIRLDGRKLHMESFFIPETFYSVTVGDLIDHITKQISTGVQNPTIVYVDDEEENLFIFKRKFGKDFNLKVFGDPRDALEYINADPDVRLVITDEVMPAMRGNELCDQVHKAKPFIKFILITGNPEGDNNLMYQSLRGNRFYDFIQKPVDFDGKRDQYLKMIKALL